MALVEGVPAVADGWVGEGSGRPGNRLQVNIGMGLCYVPVAANATREAALLGSPAPPAR